MRRSTLFAVAALFAGFMMFPAHAQMHGSGMMSKGGMMGDSTAMMGKAGQGRMMECGGMMTPMMGMGMMGCGGMMCMGYRQIIPIDDGIIVVMGNRLIKFDKNLKKEAETTIEFDEKALKNMMENMKKMHSMYSEMMGEKAKEKK